MEIEISIASPPYREKRVVQLALVTASEVYIWAEIDQDGPRLRIEFYEPDDRERWQLDYDEVVTALLEAKGQLGFD
jgi:hypothetical protein